MNARRIITISLIGAGVVAAVLAWREAREVRRLRGQLSGLVTERAHWEAEGTALAKRNDWLARQRGEMQRKVQELRKHPRVPVGQKADDVARSKALGEVDWDPKMQNLVLKTFRAQLALKYARLYRLMGWSAEQSARFEELKTQAYGRLIDDYTAAHALGLKPTGPEVAPMLADNTEQLKQQEIDLLGVSGYAQMDEYDKSEKDRQIVNSVAANLLFTVAPMSADQTDQLARLIPTVIGPQELYQRAATFLSPPQMDELRSSINAHRAQTLDDQVVKMIWAWQDETSATKAP